jgi:MazG family protein
MEEFTKLVKLMESLRGEEGCPWDKKQTEKAFATFLLEEVYEVIEAIETGNITALREELGDVLFHIVFISRICEENQQFNIRDVILTSYEKMYKRHPHVFSKERDVPSVEQQWEDLKKEENKEYSPVASVPKMLPALLRAYEISRRAAKTGFDWEKLEDIYDKMYEEIEELKEAEQSGRKEDIGEEIGDLLFTVCNISRRHSIDPEAALRGAVEKFIRRFSYVEKNADLTKKDLRAMDALWNETKEKEKEGK